jgi:RHS repeat-associated protein
MSTGRSALGLKIRKFDYDSLGRLIDLDSPNPQESAGYRWDDFGNLLEKSKGVSGNFVYINNRITNLSYSSSGNQLEANGRFLAYDDKNRLRQVTGLGFDVSYSYDGKGNRVKIYDAKANVNRFFVYDEGNSLIAELSQEPDGFLYVDREYVTGPSGTLASLNYTELPRGISAYNVTDRVRIYWKPISGCSTSGVRVYRSIVSGGPYELLNGGCLNTASFYDDLNVNEGTRYFYVLKSVAADGTEYSSPELAHTFSAVSTNADGPRADYARAPIYFHLNDHLGTTRSVTDTAGDEVGFFDYFPFGEPMSVDGCSPTAQRFTGKLLDSESGLQYFGARHLSNNLSRFTSVDPAAASFNPKNPQSWNRYSYSLNSPLNLDDPDGNETRINPYVGAHDFVPISNYQSSNPYANALLMGFNDLANLGAMALNVHSNAVGLVGDTTSRVLENVGFSDSELEFVNLWLMSEGVGLTGLGFRTSSATESLVQINRSRGIAFRDEIAYRLSQEGLTVRTEVYKPTIFGGRIMDIEVSRDGIVLGGIETKVGASRYTTSQRAKDAWLRYHQKYLVNVVRDQ